MDKRLRADVFRTRLNEAMQAANFSRSELARQTGVDRSTIGQILSDELVRMPNAALTADAAQALGVSADWLLGLSDRPEPPGDLIAAAMEMSEAERNTVDSQVLDWHREAAGYKIRHVPATLPDMLKTEAVKAWEYAAFLGRAPDPDSANQDAASAWISEGLSDYEIALPLHELQAFAEGSGYYHGLSAEDRREQLAHFADTCAARYPQVRLFLFDAKRAFSAPLTCFGPALAALYVGRFYLTFRDVDRVRSLIRHFDWLVREAVVDDREAPQHLRDLMGHI